MDQKLGMRDPVFHKLSMHEAKDFQKVYCIPSGPGAELGILLLRANISPRENGLDGESVSLGAGRSEYACVTSAMRVSWATWRAAEYGMGVCKLW